MNEHRNKPKTIAEFNAELAADREYQAKKAELDRQIAERVAELRAAEQPLVADLQAAGFDMGTVWDLVNTAEPYPGAVPILLEHLSRDYPGRITEAIARALAVPDAAYAWPVLREEYVQATGENAKDGLAVALSVTATAETEEDLIDLVLDERNGESRILLLDGLKWLKTRRARSVLEGLTSHPVLGQQARRTLRGQ